MLVRGLDMIGKGMCKMVNILEINDYKIINGRKELYMKKSDN